MVPDFPNLTGVPQDVLEKQVDQAIAATRLRSRLEYSPEQDTLTYHRSGGEITVYLRPRPYPSTERVVRATEGGRELIETGDELMQCIAQDLTGFEGEEGVREVNQIVHDYVVSVRGYRPEMGQRESTAPRI